MRLPSGYGSVVKLSGKRRRPFAVRTSTINKFVNVYIGGEPAETTLKALKRFKFAFKRSKGYWSAVATENALEWADTLSENGITVKIEYRQAYLFHAYFEKRDEALKYLAQMNSGEVVKVRKSLAPTFAKVYEEAMDQVMSLKKRPSEGTLVTYKYGFKALSQIHHVRIDSIKPADIQVILNANNSKTQSHMANIHKVLQKVESYALMQHYIKDGFMKYLIFEHTDTTEKKHKAYSDDEIRILWDNQGDVTVDFILITIYTGLRPSELLTIKTENIHIDDKYMIGGMKTKAGIDRTIPICDRIFDVIKRHYNPDMPHLLDMPPSYKGFQKRFEKIMRRLDFDHLPHDGRHTFASLMDRFEANQVCTKLIMGHSMSDNITEGIYTHKELKDLLYAVNLISV